MKTKTFLCSLLLSFASTGSAANILAIFTIASPSHHIWNSPLVVALARRGHNVTVLSQSGQKETVPNLTDLVMEDLYEAIVDEYNFEEMTNFSVFQYTQTAFNYVGAGCVYALKSGAFKQLMNYPKEMKFDLIITESIGSECLLSLVYKFGKPPIVMINAFIVPTWMFEITGTPLIPSYMPHYFSSATDHMSFPERVNNFILSIYTYYYYHYFYLPHLNREVKKLYGMEVPSAYEILKNVSLGMANFHPALDYPFAMSPNLIPVAGIQIQEPKPLPPDLQKFLDEAMEGAIFFSLGSNVRCDQLSEGKRQAIFEAFAELPQRVLWKFESDLPGLPKNVKIGKWLPQRDILAHPNIKLFITHSGLLSTHETIYRGVPVVGIPIMADQHLNVKRMVTLGCGIHLEYKDLTKETLLLAVREVINNPSYRENIKALSARFRDDPQTPLERAVYWTEYILRHNGAPHLQSAAKDLNFVQYFLIDVIVFLLVVPLTFIVALYSVCCRRKSKERRKLKQN